MNARRQSTELQQLLDKIIETGQQSDRITVNAILDAVGTRSFGPFLIVAGLITLAPFIGDIPGVPTVIGIIVFLIAIQLLLHRKHFWLPHWLLNRSVEREKLLRAIDWLRPPSRYIDRLMRPRLKVFAEGIIIYIIAALCLIVALIMPMMEVVPFSANIAGVVFTAFGFALIASDGLLALFAFSFTAAGVGLMLYYIL